jgi:hypothetical protein
MLDDPDFTEVMKHDWSEPEDGEYTCKKCGAKTYDADRTDFYYPCPKVIHA